MTYVRYTLLKSIWISFKIVLHWVHGMHFDKNVKKKWKFLNTHIERMRKRERLIKKPLATKFTIYVPFHFRCLNAFNAIHPLIYFFNWHILHYNGIPHSKCSDWRFVIRVRQFKFNVMHSHFTSIVWVWVVFFSFSLIHFS